MNNFIIICLVFLLLFTTACENEYVIDIDTEFKEYTVVEAELWSGGVLNGVRFTKTLPLGVEYSIEAAEIKDITAWIRVYGTPADTFRHVPIYYTGNGLYLPDTTLRVDADSTYELFAIMRGDTIIKCKTDIPERPTVTRTHFYGDYNYMEAQVLSLENEAYAAIWKIGSPAFIVAEDFFSVILSESSSSIETVRTSSIPEEFLAPIYNRQRYIEVFAFDKSFKAYFDSRTSGSSIDNPFIQSSGSIEWNVKGDNVMGMFVGLSRGRTILVE